MRLFGRESQPAAPEHEERSAQAPDAFEHAFERIEEVRAATARAASEMRDAAGRLGATQEPSSERGRIVHQLLESLAERAERLDAEARQLADVLGRAAGVLAMLEPGDQPAGDIPASPPPASVPADTPRGAGAPVNATPSGTPAGASPASMPPPPRSIPRRENGRAPQPASEGVRLLATQMVVAGSSREEIEARLRSEFEVEDAGAVLDEILGSVPQ